MLGLRCPASGGWVLFGFEASLYMTRTGIGLLQWSLQWASLLKLTAGYTHTRPIRIFSSYRSPRIMNGAPKRRHGPLFGMVFFNQDARALGRGI